MTPLSLSLSLSLSEQDKILEQLSQTHELGMAMSCELDNYEQLLNDVDEEPEPVIYAAKYDTFSPFCDDHLS